MLLYEQTCMECGNLLKRIRVKAYQDNLLYSKQMKKCDSCGSNKLKLELINKPLTFSF